ncbi:DNA repair protein RecO [Fulvivirgaceae bacterium BMA12]|uniref:DNA repair protein RecO n=1 Tax=Agaribacillus aureus TaxID=3051825 RepID=A0ABT8LIA3_9BACT|nr:DNA repair protein RecO [Fulvivirgaceae bacterium BMA12]
MLYKTQGIVLNYIKYRETSIIVRIYTESFGLTSYIVNGVRSKKARHKIAFFQPLTLLDMVVYHKKNTQLNRVSELKCLEPLMHLPTDIKKSSMAIFITEILIKSLKGEEENQALFHFLHQSILILENMPDNFQNFHLQFLLKLCGFLGFAPASAHEISTQLAAAGAKASISDEEENVIDLFIKEGYDNKIKINNRFRRAILYHVLAFYKIHIESFGEVKSMTILNEVLN